MNTGEIKVGVVSEIWKDKEIPEDINTLIADVYIHAYARGKEGNLFDFLFLVGIVLLFNLMVYYVQTDWRIVCLLLSYLLLNEWRLMKFNRDMRNKWQTK